MHKLNDEDELKYKIALKNYISFVLRKGKVLPRSSGCTLRHHFMVPLCSCGECGNFSGGGWRDWVDIPKYPG